MTTTTDAHTVRANLAALRPPWAEALIVAECEHDASDLMTDYFATTTSRTVALAWSRHKRDIFSELRKAAALFPETAHLGPGMGLWRPRIVLCSDAQPGNGCAYWKGSPSHWHRELCDGETFTTEAEARAFMAAKGEPEPIHLSGTEAPTAFAWELDGGTGQLEHREKYSMGAGYYLKAAGRYSDGWLVHKRGIHGHTLDGEAECLRELAGLGGAAPAAPAAAAPVDRVTVSMGRGDNVEVRFPAKPSEAVRAQLKLAGFRWHGASCCWYGPAARLSVLEGIAGAPVTVEGGAP